MVRTERDREKAYHEAGHCVVACCLQFAPVRLTIEAEGPYGGLCTSIPYPLGPSARAVSILSRPRPGCYGPPRLREEFLGQSFA